MQRSLPSTMVACRSAAGAAGFPPQACSRLVAKNHIQALAPLLRARRAGRAPRGYSRLSFQCVISHHPSHPSSTVSSATIHHHNHHQHRLRLSSYLPCFLALALEELRRGFGVVEILSRHIGPVGLNTAQNSELRTQIHRLSAQFHAHRFMRSHIVWFV